MSRDRQNAKRGLAADATLALVATAFTLAAALFYLGGGIFNALANPLYMPATGAVAATLWLAAIVALRRRLSARKTLRQLMALSPVEFEEWTAVRFRALGYTVHILGAPGDHGVDLALEKGDEQTVVQCKRYGSTTVGEPVLRDLYGAMHGAGAQRAFLVTTGTLTGAAERWIAGKPIEVWDGQKLVKMAR